MARMNVSEPECAPILASMGPQGDSLERERTLALLHLIDSQPRLPGLMAAIMNHFQQWSGCDAVGIRLRDGDDFPYYTTCGFRSAFVAAETQLCIRNPTGHAERDTTGNPQLACMCGNVLCERFDPSKPFFTARGSFWSNGTTKLLASTTEKDRQSRTRNRCNGEGYESVALIALRGQGETFGLLQLNDRRPDRFSAEGIAATERMCDQVALALANRKLGRALAHSEARYRQAAENVPDVLWAAEADTERVVFVGPSIERLLGYTPSEILGACSDVGKAASVTRPWLAGLGTRAAACRRGETRTYTDEVEQTCKDGSSVWTEIASRYYLDAEEGRVDVFGVIRDITERRRLEDERRRLEHRAMQTQRLEALGVLAAGIAHDFNNLLGGIFGYIDLARTECASGSAIDKYLEKAQLPFGRARDLAGRLLTFAKGGAPMRKPMDIGKVIEDSVRFAVRDPSVVVDVSISANLSPCAVDELQLAQVIDNLVANALQAMPTGGRVRVEARPVTMSGSPTLMPGDYVQVSFTDTGVGIAPDIIGRIFDPFFTTKALGRGLGLASVHSILRRHDGDVTVESTLGRGSTFNLFLPVATAQAGASTIPVAAHQGAGRVLVMDDEDSIRDTATVILQSLGYDIVTVCDGQKALDAHRVARQAGFPFVAVILDLTVPGGLGGQETIKRIRETDSSIKAFVSSGYASDPVMSDPVAHGFNDLIAKPYRRSELLALFGKHLGRR